MSLSMCVARLCLAVLLITMLGTMAGPLAQGQESEKQLDERAPKIPRKYWKSPTGLSGETPQQLREKEELLRLIERVQAIRLRRKQDAPPPPEPNEPAASTEVPKETEKSPAPDPNGLSPADPNVASPEVPVRPPPAPVVEVPPAAVTPALPSVDPNATVANTLALLEAHAGRAGEVDRPFDMAEMLRQSGFLPEAATYYRVALTRLEGNDPTTKRRHAWALFQAGTCLRLTDPSEAGHMYRQLLREHPDSIWKEAAETWLSLVDWYAVEKPWELLESLKGKQPGAPTEMRQGQSQTNDGN